MLRVTSVLPRTGCPTVVEGPLNCRGVVVLGAVGVRVVDGRVVVVVRVVLG